jgi:prepilin-type N-terminal cleavage/methylation domain-containing protein
VSSEHRAAAALQTADPHAEDYSRREVRHMAFVARRLDRQSGFTLVEVLTTITIAGILMATAVVGMFSLARSQQQASTAQALLSSMRAAQASAQGEGRAYCVRIDSTTSWSTWRYSCDPAEATSPGSPTKVATSTTSGTAYLASFALSASSISGLAHSCPGSALGCAFFYPRGLASSGTLDVRRPSSSSKYTLTVVGITGRVFITH